MHESLDDLTEVDVATDTIEVPVTLLFRVPAGLSTREDLTKMIASHLEHGSIGGAMHEIIGYHGDAMMKKHGIGDHHELADAVSEAFTYVGYRVGSGDA